MTKRKKKRPKTIGHNSSAILLYLVFNFTSCNQIKKPSSVIYGLRFDPRKMACTKNRFVSLLLFFIFSSASKCLPSLCTFFMITAYDTFRALFINATKWKVNKFCGWQRIRISCHLKIVFAASYWIQVKICSLRTYNVLTYGPTYPAI